MTVEELTRPMQPLPMSRRLQRRQQRQQQELQQLQAVSSNVAGFDEPAALENDATPTAAPVLETPSFAVVRTPP